MSRIVAVIPAAGRATRIAPLPCSKELYPVGLRGEGEAARPKVVSHHLLGCLRRAGIRQAFVVLREGKWDIPTYYNDGTQLLDMDLAYLMMRLPHGSPFTIDQAFPFVPDARVALGFPDILFGPEDAFVHLIARQEATGADVVLGLVPCDRPASADMVDVDEAGRLRHLHVKEDIRHLRYTWIVALWTPTFTRFLHAFLADALASGEATAREFQVGHVVLDALDAGLHIETVAFPDGWYVDIGAPETLARLPLHFLHSP